MLKNFSTLENLNEDEQLRQMERQELEGAHAIMFRHANSMANAGFRTNDAGSIPLSEEGKLQAQHVADFIMVPPSKIIHSPYIRTRLTAEPSIAKFPQAEVVTWPIQEFTYLNGANHVGTTAQERRIHTEKYWQEADPKYRDGGDAESFEDFWERVADFRKRITELQPGNLIFSHGQFMRMLIIQSGSTHSRPDKLCMQAFKADQEVTHLANTFRLAIEKTGQLSTAKVNHLPKNLITY